jgi:hypothetical protein
LYRRLFSACSNARQPTQLPVSHLPRATPAANTAAGQSQPFTKRAHSYRAHALLSVLLGEHGEGLHRRLGANARCAPTPSSAQVVWVWRVVRREDQASNVRTHVPVACVRVWAVVQAPHACIGQLARHRLRRVHSATGVVAQRAAITSDVWFAHRRSRTPCTKPTQHPANGDPTACAVCGGCCTTTQGLATMHPPLRIPGVPQRRRLTANPAPSEPRE